MLKIKQSEILGFVILAGCFIGGYVMAQPLSFKIVGVGIEGISVAFGSLFYVFIFTFLNITHEIYGKVWARLLGWMGIAGIMMALAAIQLALLWPKAASWQDEFIFHQVFYASNRIVIGGLVAYVVAQYVAVQVFAAVQAITGKKSLWMRNGAALAVAQLVDTILFVMIGFYGRVPVVELMMGTYVSKFLLILLSTPLAYFGVIAIKRLNAWSAHRIKTT